MSWKTVTTIKKVIPIRLNKRNNFRVYLDTLEIPSNLINKVTAFPMVSKITLGRFSRGYRITGGISYDSVLRKYYVGYTVSINDIKSTPFKQTTYWYQYDSGQTTYKPLTLYAGTVYAIIIQWFDSNNTGGGITRTQDSRVYIDGQLLSYARDYKEIPINGIPNLSVWNMQSTNYVKRVGVNQTLTVTGNVGSGRAYQGVDVYQYSTEYMTDIESEISCLIIVGD
ncbi:MAG: hypothetical protein ACRC92_21785 [Peptostreptococcaceae bacterium]